MNLKRKCRYLNIEESHSADYNPRSVDKEKVKDHPYDESIFCMLFENRIFQ